MSAWYSKEVNKSGKRSLVWKEQLALDPCSPIEIACGQCSGCRLERSRQWAVRCLHESSLYENNCFLTLTYSPEALEKRGDKKWSVDVADYQLFMKRLRKKYVPKNPHPLQTPAHTQHAEKHCIRYFHCGEYGETLGRPHYHACLFNHDFHDKTFHKLTKNGDKLYISESLKELWPHGDAYFGDVTFKSAAYVARYVMKKQTGDKATIIDETTGLSHYEYLDEETGEIYLQDPEYTTMSRRPGIGANWLKKYKTDVYPDDFVIINGKKMQPPKFYDKKYFDQHPEKQDCIKEQRDKKADLHYYNNTPERLAVREKIHQLKVKQLERNHDNDK